jgi:hypothetical protein
MKEYSKLGLNTKQDCEIGSFMVGDLEAKAEAHPNLSFSPDFIINGEAEGNDNLEQKISLLGKTSIQLTDSNKEGTILSRGHVANILYIRKPLEDNINIKTEIGKCNEALVYESTEFKIELQYNLTEAGTREILIKSDDSLLDKHYTSITDAVYDFVKHVTTAAKISDTSAKLREKQVPIE